MNVCAICSRGVGVAPLHATSIHEICGRCVERLAQRLPLLGAQFGRAAPTPLAPEVFDADDDGAQPTLEELLTEFKESATKVLQPDDVQVRFDLGIAYREMGLHDDAMKELAIALLHARGERLAQVLNAIFGKDSGWKGDLQLLRDALYPA